MKESLKYSFLFPNIVSQTREMFMSMDCTCVEILEEVNKFMIVVHLPGEHQAMCL